jgi:hypothetical protein
MVGEAASAAGALKEQADRLSQAVGVFQLESGAPERALTVA